MSHNPGSRAPKNPWNRGNTVAKKLPSKQEKQNGSAKSAEVKLKEAQHRLQRAAQKYANEYESSEEEDDLETESVIGSILKEYEATGVKGDFVGNTKGFLEEILVSGASTCLICISSVKRNEPIWSCSRCHSPFHLLCIQRWSKDTVVQKKRSLEDQIIAKRITMTWGCPKCRIEYDPDEIPSEYRCFCGKTTDPVFQPLLAPHSCGERCGKPLQPPCGHFCLLLCHPGACPPCPKTVTTACHCGSSKSKTQRCSNKEWSCGATCNKLLACGKHKCGQGCHTGTCASCSKKSMQKCMCRAEIRLCDCATPLWQCKKVCGKPLECGFHNCDQVCHPGECDQCLLSKVRTCPCGKTFHQLPCTEEPPTCGDTCDKILECGMHVCNDRCHKGKCMSCVETVIKSCRCGLHQKEIQCKKLYLCDTKCKEIKDCNKHPCNRKCCDGNCPPCEKPCGRTLSCKKHTCSSICHQGPCYPCSLTELVFCRCEFTSVTVPCGKKSKTKPPRCPQLCKLPPECHHPNREQHRCHFGDCPSCRQTCHKTRPNCQHLCPAPCHTSVMVKIEGKKATTPWEDEGPKLAKKQLPCPDCMVPVPITCLGGHETSDWPCHLARKSSCHKPCGRMLKCGNHTCTKQCHSVDGQSDSLLAGTNCEECENGCSRERPKHCTHACPKPCHPKMCPPCTQMIKARCHCGNGQPYVACKDWELHCDGDNVDDLVVSCGNQCPKNFACGHRCRENCHAGECPNQDQCRKKVKVACQCKRLRREFSCETVRNGKAEVPCDETCLQKQSQEQLLKQKQDEERRKEEELRNQRELEMFEKKFQGKKKNRERRVVENANNESWTRRHWLLIVGVAISLIGIIVYHSV